MKPQNIAKLYEAFDAFANKEFDASGALLHEFFVTNARKEISETWEVPSESDEDVFADDEVGGDMGDDFTDDVTDPEADLGDAMDVDVEIGGEDGDADEPATRQDIMDLDDKIDELVAMFKEEGEFDLDADEGEEDEGDEEGAGDFDDFDKDENEEEIDEMFDVDLDEAKDEDDDAKEEDLEEGVSFSDVGNVKHGDDGANAKSPHPKQNPGGKIDGKMGKTAKEETGGSKPSVKDEVQTKDGNQGSGKDRQKKVADSDKASKTPTGDDNVKSPMNKG